MKLLARILGILLSIHLLFTASSVSAQTEFAVNYLTDYKVGENGQTEVSQQITLTNNFSRIYATSYTLVLEGKRPENIEARQGEESLPFSVSEDAGQTKIIVSFPNAIVGKGESRNFTISYNFPDIAVQNGQVWDINIPRLESAELIDSYTLRLWIPQNFGKAAYISPAPRSQTPSGNSQVFSFQKEDLTKAGIVAAFGEFQVFSFKLSYHLKNPYPRTGVTEIALPPDTAFQRVYYQEINPAPDSVTLDEDGNWLARYRLRGNQSLDVIASGSTQLFSRPQEHYPKITPQDRGYYLDETRYWQAQNPQIQSLAKNLETPRAIYDFAVANLSYDYNRVQEGVERLGATQALASPNNAVCMEFTDVFITLSRAAGVPAREINGFAYTEDPEIQPLSLVADVLHAWPEFWDEGQKIWKPVDPTWGNTTGGVDYFEKFDLSHITFVIHGKDPNYPPPAGSYKLGDEPQKDVEVKFGSLPSLREPRLEFSGSLPTLILPFFHTQFKLSIRNTGTVAAYDIPLNVRTEGVALAQDQETIDFLAPHSEQELIIPIRLSLFPSRSPNKIEADILGSQFVYNIPISRTLVPQAVVIFAFLTLVGAGLILLTHTRLYGKVTKRLKNFTQRSRDLPL